MATIRHELVGRPPLAEPARTTGRGRAAGWWADLAWVGAAAVLGFAIAAIFAGWLEVPRSWFVLAYAAVAVPFVIAYARWAGIDPGGLVRRHWQWGLGGAIVVGAFVVFSVQRQDGGPRADGGRLAFDLLWWGVAYGLLDALLLTVLPIAAVWRAAAARGWTAGWLGRVEVGAAAVVASLIVTAAYHLGFPEFRGADLGSPLFGNGVMTLGTVLAGNPLTAILSHIAMHVAAVLHGAGGTVQLPPHS